MSYAGDALLTAEVVEIDDFDTDDIDDITEVMPEVTLGPALLLLSLFPFPLELLNEYLLVAVQGWICWA